MKDRGKSSSAPILAALVLGAAATGLIFEAAFRITGAVMLRAQYARDRTAGRRYTILCEGDSFTYGLGGEDFPAQLERTLNRRAGKDLYRVVNKGLPGMNTAVLADRLGSHLARYRPDIVIVLAGEDNAWNTAGLRLVGGGVPFQRAVDQLLLRSRVYKFVKMMVIGMRRDGFSRDRTGEPHQGDGFPKEGYEFYLRAQSLEENRQYAEARVLYEKFAALNPDHPAGQSRAASCLLGEGRYDDAVAGFRKAAAMRKTPETEMVYFEWGYALSQKGLPGEAIEVWKKGLAEFPESIHIFQALARRDGPGALAYADKNPAVRSNLGFQALSRSAGEKTVPAGTGMRQFMAESSGAREPDDMDLLISRGLRADVERIYAIGESHGVRTLFASYPDHAYPEVVAAAQDMKATFVDFRGVFKQRFKGREEYIADDECHLNTRGYEVMAEVLADEVEKIHGKI